MLPEIFLSYSREDRAVAQRFVDAFAREGLEIWWDNSIRSGDTFDEAIDAALRSAKVVVVLWSPKSVASRWVRSEATIADRNGTLMPTIVAPCDRPVAFELTQTADLSHWRGKADDPAWKAFVGDVRRVLERKARTPDASKIQPHEPAFAAKGSAALPMPKLNWTRRATVNGLAVAGAATAIGTAGWFWTKQQHVPDPRAVQLYKRAQQIEKNGVVEAFGEARAAYKQAVAIDPDYAEAWGALALSFVNPSFGGGCPLPAGRNRSARRRSAPRRSIPAMPRRGWR